MPEYETVYGQITRRTDEREHYHDRAARAAMSGVVLDVYVIDDDTNMIGSRSFSGFLGVDAASGIVGSPGPGDGKTTIDYEGNVYGHENLRSWADRVYHAADRHITVYPTVARSVVPSTMLTRIGTYEVATNRINLEDPDFLRAWIGDDAYAELVITKEGTVLTDAALRKLADEAERGYDPALFKQRPNRRQR